MSEIAIKLENVSKYYKLYSAPKDRLKEALHPFGRKYHNPFYALKGLNLEIKKGDILGIVGRNGCGKSTILKIIAGVLQPSEGRVTVNKKVTALLELGAGFNPEFTGIENIKFYAQILGIAEQELEIKLPLIIEFAELGDFLFQPVKTYSSGMKARLGFSVAVHVDPEILILDEVLAVGDTLFKRKCYAKMDEFFSAGKTIIYVSHDTNSVNQLCNRAVLIHEGNVLMDDDPKEVTKYYEKLLFSRSENIQEVIDEVKSNINVQASEKKEVRFPVDSRFEKGLKSYYIDYLESKSKVEYRNEAIDIKNPHFTTLEGDVVNVLVRGQEYFYHVAYESRSSNIFNNISFGFDVKSEKGQLITSVQSVLSNKANIGVRNLCAQDVVKVTFKFHCLLNAGLYFTNNGVSAYTNGLQMVLNRLVDAVCFKVIQKPDQVMAGLVSLVSELEINASSEKLKVSLE